MKKAVFAFLALLVALLCGCNAYEIQIQAQVANGVAMAANASLPVLVDAYRQEGLRAIDSVAKAGGTAEDAKKAVAKVEEAWRPIWQAWETLRVAEDSWAKALEQDGDFGAALLGMRDAYCGFLKIWPKTVPVTPLAPLACGGTP